MEDKDKFDIIKSSNGNNNSSQYIKLKFKIKKCETTDGKNACITGNHPLLCNWNYLFSTKLLTNQNIYPLWEQ